jgi:hypothetical protein
VDVKGINPVPPYTDWSTAATNIQEAIDVSVEGDSVLVTNGVYATGGRVVFGSLTNRVVIDKSVLVQSVNGPFATVIKGAWDPISTNGAAAVRCVWMTNNAILSGFTLSGGATRAITPSPNQSMEGGGVFGTSNTATVINCVLTTNFASYLGGGAFSVTLNDCTLSGNHALGSGRAGGGIASAGSGGGAANSHLKNCIISGNYADQSNGGGVYNSSLANCVLTGNSSYLNGGGADGGTLVNCTVTANTASGYSSGYGAAVYGAKLTNCIVFGNFSRTSYPNTNYASCTLAYCCANPLAGGAGNIDSNPQFLMDGIHLAKTSPCNGAGDAGVVSGTDIDGQTWGNPPAIGCDEWHPDPIILGQPDYRMDAPRYGLTFNVETAGQEPFSYFWSKDGAPIQDNGHYNHSSTADLVVNHLGPDDAGTYQVVVTNSSGVVISAVAQVVIHVVDAAGTNPVIPFFSWSDAATNIQDAINVASAGDIVLVTNGVYSSGGRVMTGDLTNRVVLNKAITVMSVNGYKDTIIQGAWDPISTNGPEAVRCVWISNDAKLTGFTLQNGATRATGDGYNGGPLESGGGVWFDSNRGIVCNCVFTNNSAVYGGGMANGLLINSLVVGNYASQGAGTYYSFLTNCTVAYNYNLTSSQNQGAGTYAGSVANSIVIHNYDSSPFGDTEDDYAAGLGQVMYSYSCTFSSYGSPPLKGTGNIINADPEFLDAFHISSLSPGYGTGSAGYASGYDLDDEPWNTPPSMGCDEVVISNLVGALSVNLTSSQTNLLTSSLKPPFAPHYGFFEGSITGRAAYIAWSFGDGPILTNSGASLGHFWTNPGDYTVRFTAYNRDNPDGVSTNLMVHVMQPDTPHLLSPGLQSNEFQFQFATQSNVTYVVQYTTNLVPPINWTTLQTIYYPPENVIQVNDASPSDETRFYRVLAQ